jgi:hypothetical protein
MSDAASDFDFVGPAYQAPALLQSNQTLINWYMEVAQVKGAKVPIALLGTPGLNPLQQLTPNAEIRGAWVTPNVGSGFSTQSACMWVSGADVWVMFLVGAATITTPPVFTVGKVGSLLTSSGPVCIRDNGVSVAPAAPGGGFVIIVDGQYGYYYNLAGVTTHYPFTGGVTTGSATISLPGTLPIGLLMSNTAFLSDTVGAFPPNFTYIASIDYNTPALTASSPSAATNGSTTLTLNIPAFGRLTDPGFIGADRIAFIEGWLILNQPNTRTFFTSGPVPYQLCFPPSFFALKDSSTDNLITLFENNRELWLIGSRTSEVWYNAGGQNFAFQRIPGVGPQIGCAAKHSITRMGPQLIWLAKNEQGENIVVMTREYGWEKVSSHGVEHAISQYSRVDDAIGYAYEEEGHFFYVLIFPTADNTWVYDHTASERYGDPVWHQRLSYSSSTGTYHRHRSNCFADFANVRMVGDYQTGQIHQMSRQFYTDAGNVLKAQRRTPHVWTPESRKRVFHSRLQIEFTPGVGLQTGQGTDPQAMLRWSDDGGFTWSNEHWTSIGKVGYTKNRAVWNRLGQAWDRVYEVSFTDPTARDVIGATLFGDAEEEEV